MMWQVRKQSDGEVVFTGESWKEANEVAHVLKHARGYNHNLLIIVGVPEQEQPGPTPVHDVQTLRDQVRLLWAVIIPLQNQVRQLETWIGQSPEQRALDIEGQKLNERADIYFPDKPI